MKSQTRHKHVFTGKFQWNHWIEGFRPPGQLMDWGPPKCERKWNSGAHKLFLSVSDNILIQFSSLYTATMSCGKKNTKIIDSNMLSGISDFSVAAIDRLDRKFMHLLWSVWLTSTHIVSGEPLPCLGHLAPGPGHPVPGVRSTGPSYIIHLGNPTGRLRNGIKSATKPGTSADHSSHVLLVSSHLYPRPSVGILRVSSLRIPLASPLRFSGLEVALTHRL
jgi:hypothetical protein